MFGGLWQNIMLSCLNLQVCCVMPITGFCVPTGLIIGKLHEHILRFNLAVGTLQSPNIVITWLYGMTHCNLINVYHKLVLIKTLHTGLINWYGVIFVV